IRAQNDNGATTSGVLATYELDIAGCSCENVGENTVTLTVRDINTNAAWAEATVTVEDNIAPVVVTQNITVQLDANGEATIIPAQVEKSVAQERGLERCERDITGKSRENGRRRRGGLSVSDASNKSEADEAK